jgi:hypothetical protein
MNPVCSHSLHPASGFNEPGYNSDHPAVTARGHFNQSFSQPRD